MVQQNKCDLPPVFVIGYPADCGGANTECWHTLKLWRRFGLEVTLVPTWKATEKWRAKLDDIGCSTVETLSNELDEVPGLQNSLVVSFCNDRFLHKASCLRQLGCKTIWSIA